MGQQDPLGPSRHGLHAGHCEAYGATRQLGVAPYQTPVGVFYTTSCDPCVAAGTPPPMRSWPGTVERVGAHCQHVGIDVDQMAALLYGEGGGDGQG
jgi:hypothetical protein